MCVRLNEFVLPIQAKKKSRIKISEKESALLPAPLNRPRSNSALNPSDFIFLVILCLIELDWLTNHEKLNQTPTKEPKGFNFSIWVMSELWARQGNNHNIQRLTTVTSPNQYTTTNTTTRQQRVIGLTHIQHTLIQHQQSGNEEHNVYNELRVGWRQEGYGCQNCAYLSLILL